MSADKGYRIQDGVRRAKAFQLAGLDTIQARLMFPDAKESPTFQVALSTLRSPKPVIDLDEGSNRPRWENIWKAIQQGMPECIPHIVVVEDSSGTPLSDVQVIP